MIFGWPRVDYYGSKESVFKKKTIGPRKRPMVIVVSVPRSCTRDEDRPLGLLCSPLDDLKRPSFHNTQSSCLEEVFSCSPSGLSKSQEKLCVAVCDSLFISRAHRELLEELARLRHRTIGVVG
jgi:hypothetical protein